MQVQKIFFGTCVTFFLVDFRTLFFSQKISSSLADLGLKISAPPYKSEKIKFSDDKLFSFQKKRLETMISAFFKIHTLPCL